MGSEFMGSDSVHAFMGSAFMAFIGVHGVMAFMWRSWGHGVHGVRLHGFLGSRSCVHHTFMAFMGSWRSWGQTPRFS